MFRGLRRFAAVLAIAGFDVTAGSAQPTSYSRQIAPILALSCHGCHGANPESVAGGLSTREWADLNKGSNLGPVIHPGDPERSPLYQFVSGTRGEAHRMPLGGPPLAVEEIEAIRKWIVEGATEDADTAPKYRIELPSVRLERSTPVRIAARIPATAYIELALADSQERTLYREGGAVKSVRASAGIGVSGQWIVWSLRRASDWPERVRAKLTIRYATPEPDNSVLVAGAEEPERPTGGSETWILAMSDNRVVAQRRGIPSLDQLKRELEPGWYILHARHTGGSERAVLFQAGKSR